MSRKRIANKNPYSANANLNLAPFVDILFSILIVFMVPSQAIFGGMKLELPSADAEVIVLEKDPIKIYIDSNSNVAVNEDFIEYNKLISKVNEVSFKDKNIKIYVIADKANNYGFILNIVGKLKSNGFKDVVLITDLYNRIWYG